MSSTANPNDELFESAPLLRWERSLGLVKPGQPRAARRALLAVLFGWLPLAILAAIQFLMSSDESARSFLTDYAVHVRFLVVVPALIFAEAECIPHLGRIANHFEETGLVIPSDKARYHAAVSSTSRLLNSSISDAVTLVLAYGIVAALAFYFSGDALLAWHRRGSTGAFRFSLAGWWHVLVSLPLLLVIVFGWFWRLALWTRFLFLMSRLDLHLIAGHPDRAGGLNFVSWSLHGFRLVSFAAGAVVAGSISNRVAHQNPPRLDFEAPVIALVIVLLILFAGPLTIFFKKLRQTKRQGVFEYGALARDVGTHFEAKWLRQSGAVDKTSLEVQDFSATTDLYAIAANVYAMREVPFGLRDLIGPIVLSALLPFIPVALLAVPLDVIINGIAKLLI